VQHGVGPKVLIADKPYMSILTLIPKGFLSCQLCLTLAGSFSDAATNGIAREQPVGSRESGGQPIERFTDLKLISQIVSLFWKLALFTL
jgi:hypothetical protein